MSKRKFLFDVSTILFSLSMIGSLYGCQTTTSITTDTTPITTEKIEPSTTQTPTNSSVTPSTDEKLHAEVSSNLEVVWGTKDLDLTQFFTIKNSTSEHKVTADMITGSVDTSKEGTYPIELKTTIEGDVLEAKAEVKVISKVEITTPNTENPIYNRGSLSAPDGETETNLFRLTIDDKPVDVIHDWISGAILDKKGDYPITLTVPVNGKTYAKTVTVHVVDHEFIISTSSIESNPFEVEKDEYTNATFDYSSLFSLNGGGAARYVFVDKDSVQESAKDTGIVVLGTVDKSKIDLSKVGTYPVTGSVTDDLGNILSVTAYVKVVTNIHIESSQVKGFYKVGSKAVDPKSFFTVKQGKETIAPDKFTIKSGSIDWSKAGSYNLVAEYTDGEDIVDFTRQITIVDSSFFGTFTRIDIGNKGYWCQITINEDGTATYNWQKKGMHSVETTGTLTLDSSSQGAILTKNDTWNVHFYFNYVDGIFSTKPTNNTIAADSAFYDNVSLFLKDDKYDVKGAKFYKDTGALDYGVDLLKFTSLNNPKEVHYLGLYKKIKYSVYTLLGIYLDGHGLNITVDEKTGKYKATFPNLASFGFTLTDDTTEGGTDNKLQQQEDAFIDFTLPVDSTGVSGHELTPETTKEGEQAKTLTFNFSLDYSDQPQYKASGTLINYQNISAQLLEDKDGFATFLVANLSDADDNGVRGFQLYKVKINKATYKYTLEDLHPNADADGLYIFHPNRVDVGVYIAGDYAITISNVKYTTVNYGKVNKVFDDTYNIDLFTKDNFNKNVELKFTDGFNSALVTDNTFLSLLESGNSGYLYNAMKGKAYVKGTNATYALNDKISNEDYQKLFTGKYLDAKGAIQEIDPSKLTIDSSLVNTSATGTYLVRASFVNPVDGKTYVGTAVISVEKSDPIFAEYAGTYTGYWTYGPNGNATAVLYPNGYLDLTIGSMEYGIYLDQRTSNVDDGFVISQAGYQGTLWLKDGAMYAIVAKGADTVSYFVAVKGEAADYTIEATNSTDGVEGLNYQAVFIYSNKESEIDTGYLLSESYHGRVTWEDSHDIETGIEGVTGLEYVLNSPDKQDFARVRVYKSTETSIVQATDTLYGTYTYGDQELVLDGFGKATIGEVAYNYLIGNDNKLLLQQDADKTKYLNVSVDPDKKVATEIEKGDALENKTFRVRVEYQSGSNLAGLYMDFHFDGKGFLRGTSEMVNGDIFAAYTLNEDGSITVSSLSVKGSQLTLTKLDSGNYLVETDVEDGFFINVNFTIPNFTTFIPLDD